MRKLLHKAAAFLLILTLGVSALLYVFYDAAQFLDKKEAGEQLERCENMQTIRLAMSEFNAARDGNELWRDGKLYDVKSYTVQGDWVIATVFHDGNEESLVKNIAGSFEPNDSYVTDNTVHLVRHHIHPPNDLKVLVSVPQPRKFFTVAQKRTTWFNLLVLSDQYQTVYTPPPDISLA